MSVLIPSKLGSEPAEKKPADKQGSRSRKSKKDYVYKFWATLSKHCEPVMNKYIGKLQEKQMNSLKSGQNGSNDSKSTTGSETKTETEAEEENVGISFEELGAFMANKQLIVLVGKFWSLLRAYVNKEGIRKESMKDARIILSTLMISMFPSDLLDAADANDMDPLSRRCYTAAQRVLMKVFILKDKVSKTKVHCQEAYKAIGDFLDAFKDWQTQDKTKLIKIGLNQYEQWQRSYHVIKLTNMNQGQKEGVLKVIETNIKNMKERILKVLDGNQDKMNQLCSKIDEKLKIEQAEAAQHRQVPTRAEPQVQPQSQSQPQAEAPNQTATTSFPKQAATTATTSGTSDSSVISSSTMASAQNNGDNGDHDHSQQSPKRPQGRQKGVNHEEKTPPKVKNDAVRQQDQQQQQQQQQQTIEEKLRARGVPVNMKTGRNLSGNNSFSNSPAASNNFGFSYYSDSEEKKSDNENNDNNNNIKSSRFVTEINGSKFLNLDAIIMEEASRKYWLDFEKEISKENWSRLFELLTEILSRVKKLSPKKDSKMLDDMIDVKFIQQTIEHGLVDASGFYGIYFGIWKQLKSLHAPARDDAWDKWHDETLQNMSKPDATWGKLLSSVFNTFLIKIDEIEDQTKAIYQSVKNKK